MYISEQTVRSRMRKGMSEEEARTLPLRHESKQRSKYKVGNRYYTIYEICSCYDGLTVNKIKHRYHEQKMSMEEILLFYGYDKNKLKELHKVGEYAGNRYNDLVVLDFIERDKYKESKYLCKCRCGNYAILPIRSVERGIIKNCGCKRKTKNFVENGISDNEIELFIKDSNNYGIDKTTIAYRIGKGYDLDRAKNTPQKFRSYYWRYHYNDELLTTPQISYLIHGKDWRKHLKDVESEFSSCQEQIFMFNGNELKKSELEEILSKDEDVISKAKKSYHGNIKRAVKSSMIDYIDYKIGV